MTLTMRKIDKALGYVRKNIDIDYINHIVLKSMQMGCPPSMVDSPLADNVRDLLDDYSTDNDLPNDWWCEWGDIDEIIDRI
jgi:hypothetical protein